MQERALLETEKEKNKVALQYFNGKQSLSITTLALIVPLTFTIAGLGTAEISKNLWFGIYYYTIAIVMIILTKVFWGIFTAAEQAEEKVIKKLYGTFSTPLKELKQGTRRTLIEDWLVPRGTIDRFFPSKKAHKFANRCACSKHQKMCCNTIRKPYRNKVAKARKK